jgi:hypothetical protein
MNSYQDTLYLGLIAAGLALSVLAFLALGGLAWRERAQRTAAARLELEKKNA